MTKLKLPEKRYNFHCGDQPREDYENKDIRIKPDDSYMLQFEIEGTVSTIMVNPGCLEGIPKMELKKFLDSWYKAMKPDGRLVVYYSDPFILANQLVYSKFPLDQYERTLLHSKWVSLYDMNTLCQALQSSGFKISSFNYQESIGIINATKNPTSVPV